MQPRESVDVRAGSASWRQTLYLSVLVAAVMSTPLSLGAVVAHWTGLVPWARPETATDLIRTFVVSFDVLVLTAWAPCALVMSRLR